MKRTYLLFLLISTLSLAHAQEKQKLYVFVGEKINIERFNANKKEEVSPGVFKVTISMDNAFRARYKVLENVYGNYVGDTIEFEVYEHYGEPPFASYENVLLFVSEHNGKLYHEKYQYFDVYRTKDGDWASPGYPCRFEPEMHRKKITFQQVEFKQPVMLEKVIGRKNYKTVVLEGTEVKDLFEIKKQGVLKARGLFQKSCS
ncbi:hypothetical protein ACFS7Z_12925 [Pontibacter toksunensis]|uniref:GLPGLI family protein n=1 Tax=Pontibacter toksunensis TaxID=1332631 RepID=A0ABW6BVG6_9BACT